MRPKRPKKMDAAQKEAAEHAKQFGVCMIPIKMSTLFAGVYLICYGSVNIITPDITELSVARL